MSNFLMLLSLLSSYLVVLGSSFVNKMAYHPESSPSVVELVKSQGLKDPTKGGLKYRPECPKGITFGRRFCQAQENEDLFAYLNFFYQMKHGTILESGAVDGILFSTSYFFEHALGWRSIHIESDPESFKDLKQNRPSSLNINAAICEVAQDVHWYTSTVWQQRGILEFMEQAAFPHQQSPDPSQYPVINCKPASTLISDLGIDHIDFWVLDIEGAEAQALRGFDFKKVTVDVLCIEVLRGTILRENLTEDHYRLINQTIAPLLNNGYDCIYPREPMNVNMATWTNSMLCNSVRWNHAATKRNIWCFRKDGGVKSSSIGWKAFNESRQEAMLERHAAHRGTYSQWDMKRETIASLKGTCT